jgi:two-component system heavy metal sensor histidine kinase CusS
MHLPRAGTLSLTARFAILYTCSVLVLLGIAIAFLFLSLTSDLEFEDNDFLQDKIEVLQALIANPPDRRAMLEEEVQWETAMRDHTRYMVRILDPTGKTLLETGGMGSILDSAIFPAPLDDPTAHQRGEERNGSDGNTYLVSSAWAPAGGDSRHRLLQVALDVTDEVQLLHDYQAKMTVVFALGLLISTVIGTFVARHGLQPLEEITSRTERITAAQLHERISSRPWPRELTTLALAYDGMLDRLEGSFTRLSEFSANLAHELRTPINNLMGEAEVILSQERTPEEYRQVIGSGLEEYQRLSRLIDDILFLARSEKAFTPTLFDAGMELEKLTSYYQTLADDKGVDISLSGSGSVCADPQLFQRAMGNLISNAIRYTPPGGSIRISLEPSEDGSLSLAVADTGIGMTANDLSRVFDRFYRTEQARVLNTDGSGLGLSIVKSVMELHGGSIEVASNISKGTRITLRFPSRTLPSS